MTDLREHLLPLFLIAEGVPLQEMPLEREAALLKGVLDGFLDLLCVVSDVLLARALQCSAVPPTSAIVYGNAPLCTFTFLLEHSLVLSKILGFSIYFT